MKRLLIVFIIFLSGPLVLGQAEVIQTQCPLGSYIGERQIREFLGKFEYLNDRIMTGATDIPPSEIRAVSDYLSCQKVQEFLFANPKYLKIQNNLADDEQLYLYETDSFYFVHWDYKPYESIGDENTIIFKGNCFPTLFIVIKKKKKLRKFWEFSYL